MSEKKKIRFLNEAADLDLNGNNILNVNGISTHEVAAESVIIGVDTGARIEPAGYEGDNVVLEFYGSLADERAVLRYLADPVLAVDAATKGYVDEAVANVATSGEVDLSGYLKKSGGEMSGEIKIGKGDGNGIQLGVEGFLNATKGADTKVTVLGVDTNDSNPRVIFGSNQLELRMRGSLDRPQYSKNANFADPKALALLEDVNGLANNTLSLSGGTMTGDLNLGSNSLKDVGYASTDTLATGRLMVWTDMDNITDIIPSAETDSTGQPVTVLNFDGGEDGEYNTILRGIAQPNDDTDAVNKKYLYENSAGARVDGKEFTLTSDPDTQVTAANGAEIFNDYVTNIATGGFAHAEGLKTTATGHSSHAEGYMTTASGDFGSHAEGVQCTATGTYGAHAEGFNCDATGKSAHAEGNDSNASGNYSHAEGDGTQAVGLQSHAEGYATLAKGNSSHAEGVYTTTYGAQSHSEGFYTTTIGAYSHIEGLSTNQAPSTITSTSTLTTVQEAWETSKFSLAFGDAAHAEGTDCIAFGDSSHAEGEESTASGLGAHAEGTGTTASGDYSHAEGSGTIASASVSHAEGSGTTASGRISHAEGVGATASGDYSHAEGQETTANKEGAHAEGYQTTASGMYSHAEGSNTIAYTDYAHAEGYWTIANKCAHAEGNHTCAAHYQHAQGHYNNTNTAKEGVETGTGDGTATAFVIGNGTNSSAGASNAFRVSYDGQVYAKKSTINTGADYAEYFEWADLNPDSADRRGYFVTLTGKQIKIAAPGDYVLGIVSGQPAIIGNGDEEWLGRYVFDEFGAFVYEDFEYEVEEPVEVINEETGETIIETKKVIKIGKKHKENPDYDASKPYIQRAARPEWSAVGMLGVLSVRDDGTCQVDGYCAVADGGIATASDAGYRVIERVNDHIVKVIFR